MTINEQAIIAGAKAMDSYWGGRYAPDEVEELRGEVTAMLEAAAPHLMAQAWDEGHKQGGPMHDVNYDDPDAHTRNPYRPADERGEG